MFEVKPTKTQLAQAERGYPEDAKLNTANIKEIIFAMGLSPSYENILYSYVTGKGKYEDYSKAYLKREYALDEEIKQYKALEREYKKALVKAIREYRWAQQEAEEEAEMNRYREQARALIASGDVETIAKALKTEAHKYDGMDTRFI